MADDRQPSGPGPTRPWKRAPPATADAARTAALLARVAEPPALSAQADARIRARLRELEVRAQAHRLPALGLSFGLASAALIAGLSLFALQRSASTHALSETTSAQAARGKALRDFGANAEKGAGQRLALNGALPAPDTVAEPALAGSPPPSGPLGALRGAETLDFQKKDRAADGARGLGLSQLTAKSLTNGGGGSLALGGPSPSAAKGAKRPPTSAGTRWAQPPAGWAGAAGSVGPSDAAAAQAADDRPTRRALADARPPLAAQEGALAQAPAAPPAAPATAGAPAADSLDLEGSGTLGARPAPSPEARPAAGDGQAKVAKPAPQKVARADDSLAQAEQLAAAGRCAEAVPLFGAVLDPLPPTVPPQGDPRRERALFGRGRCHLQLGNLGAGSDDLTTYETLFPHGRYLTQSHLLLGR